MEFWDAERIAAVGGAIAAIVGAIWIKGKSKTDVQTPAVHQEVVRPDTASEIKSAESQKSSAESLRDIAITLRKFERHMDVFMDRRNRSRNDE